MRALAVHCVAFAAALLVRGPGGAWAAPAPEPKLVVAIAVDQFSAQLFDQWRGRFTAGLARLSQGVVYPAGYQSHAATETCPGHSTLLTGRHPNKTGVVGNVMRDPAFDQPVYCLLDQGVSLAHGGGPPVSPARLMTDTLGDWLKRASPESRVVAVSGKDRGAIPMAGHAPDAVFWLAPGFGFTTYLRPGQTAEEALEPVAATNLAGSQVWDRSPSWAYANPECRRLEADWRFGEVNWRSTVPPQGFGASATSEAIARDLLASPLLDELTLAAARTLIRHYDLGRGPGVDLLAVGFSATDYIGHRYGVQGPEMCDQLHRLDRLIGLLLEDLDRLQTPYLIVLGADHGAADFTERLQAQGYDHARRVDGPAILARVNGALRVEFGLAADPLAGTVEESVVVQDGPEKARIAAAAARLLGEQPEVAEAFTLDELLAADPGRGRPADELTLRERFARSVYPGRSGDVLAALRPGLTAAPARPGEYVAGHGGPWDYDRRTPILFWWDGAPAETRSLPVETVDIAPTLARILGLPIPPDVDGRPLPLPQGQAGP